MAAVAPDGERLAQLRVCFAAAIRRTIAEAIASRLERSHRAERDCGAGAR